MWDTRYLGTCPFSFVDRPSACRTRSTSTCLPPSPLLFNLWACHLLKPQGSLPPVSVSPRVHPYHLTPSLCLPLCPSMHTHTYILTHTHAHMHTHTHTHTHAQACINMHTHTLKKITYTNIHSHTHGLTHTCTHNNTCTHCYVHASKHIVTCAHAKG